MDKAKEILSGLSLAFFMALFAWLLVDAAALFFPGTTIARLGPISLALLLSLLGGILIKNQNRFQPGLQFAFKNLLKVGTVLLGFRLSISEVLNIGIEGWPIVLSCIAAAFAASFLVGRFMGISLSQKILLAMGTGICGISAIMATSTAIQTDKEETGRSVAVITVFGFLALITYPFFANIIFPSEERSVGLFLGTGIHDTAQVLGAALMYQQTYQAMDVLDVATVTKMFRNLLIVVVLPLLVLTLNWRERRSTRQRVQLKEIFPLFILGFIFTVILRTLGDLNPEFAFGVLPARSWWRFLEIIDAFATFLFTVSIAGIGFETKVGHLVKTSGRAIILGFAVALGVGLTSILLLKI